MDCPNCGAYNASSSTHCRRCGHELPAESTDETEQDDWGSSFTPEEDWSEWEAPEERLDEDPNPWAWSEPEPESTPGSSSETLAESRASSYGPPPGRDTTPGGPAIPGAPGIQSYLWPSIGATLCCCTPLGIPAIIYAARVDAYLRSNDRAAAQEASDRARNWLIAAVGVAILAWIFLFVTGAFSSGDPSV